MSDAPVFGFGVKRLGMMLHCLSLDQQLPELRGPVLYGA